MKERKNEMSKMINRGRRGSTGLRLACKHQHTSHCIVRREGKDQLGARRLWTVTHP